MDHTCHAIDCNKPVAPRMLMCRAHWRLVPPLMQSAVWATYRRGQEEDKRPSLAYLKAAHAAVRKVGDLEGLAHKQTGYEHAIRVMEKVDSGEGIC